MLSTHFLHSPFLCLSVYHFKKNSCVFWKMLTGIFCWKQRTSLNLLATLFLMSPRIPLTFLATRALKWDCRHYGPNYIWRRTLMQGNEILCGCFLYILLKWKSDFCFWSNICHCISVYSTDTRVWFGVVCCSEASSHAPVQYLPSVFCRWKANVSWPRRADLSLWYRSQRKKQCRAHVGFLCPARGSSNCSFCARLQKENRGFGLFQCICPYFQKTFP